MKKCVKCGVDYDYFIECNNCLVSVEHVVCLSCEEIQ